VRSGREAEAEEHYRAAMLRQQPASFEVLANYSLFLSERGDGRAQDALRTLRAAVALNPAWAQGQYNLGNLLTSLGAEHEAEALSCYRTAVQHAPREADYHNNYALCLSNAGELRQALQHAQLALRLSPQRVDLCLNFAELLFASGETNAAIQVAAKAVENSKGQPVSEAGAYALLGTLLQAAGDDARALPALGQAWQRVHSQAVGDGGGPTSSLPLSVLEHRYRQGLKYASRLTATRKHSAAAAVYRQLAELGAAQYAV
jgi:tetratricopeptide (TPR) repeat protein